MIIGFKSWLRQHPRPVTFSLFIRYASMNGARSVAPGRDRKKPIGSVV
jgi:hypothetical protein